MSDENVSKIIITGDSTGFEAATKRSKDAAASLADAVKKAGEDQREAFKPIGDSAEKEARRVERETKTMLASVQRSTADLVSEGKKSVKLETLLDFKGIDKAPFDAVILKLREYEQAQEKTAIASRAAAAAAGSVTAPMNAMGMSAKAYSNALRNVPAQFTDIVTSLQSGQAPMTVFLQQGGQLKDLFGGAGNAAKALGGYVLGLLNPLTVTAGAAAALAVAYHQGAAEAEAFNKSLIMTGNIAGTTAGQLGDMAKTVAGSSGATIGAVAETLNEITASGKVSADMLAKVAQAAIDMERAGGSAAADTVKEFSSLGDAPVSAHVKLNDKYHFLTASVYEQVKALQDQGRETDAAKLAQDTYANAIESRVPSLVQNLGLLEKGWKGIISAAKGAWDVMSGVGRAESLNDQLATVNKKIEMASSAPVWGDIYNNSGQADIADLEKQQRVLQAMIEGERSVAAQVAAQNKAREAGLAWAQESTKYADQQAKKQAEILRVTTMMTEAGKSQTEIAKVLTQIEEKYAEKKGASARAVKEDFTELFQRAEQMKTIYAALGIEFKEIEKQNDDYAKSIAALIDPIEKEAASLERQAETYGLTREQIEQTTIARLEEAKAMAAMNGAGEDAIAFYEREIDARKRIAAASASIESRKATDDAAKHAADEWKKTADKIGDSITDALMRGFESGKSFAETLRDTVVNMFNTMVLKPVIQVTVMGGLSAIGLGSASAMASDTSSSGGLGSIGSMASSAKSAYDIFTGGASSTYNSMAMSPVGQSLGLSNVGAIYEASSDTMFMGSQLTELGSNIGSGLATAGAGLIGSAIGNAIAGDKRIISGISSSTIGAGIGALAGGPLGSAIGGVVGGLFDAAFGMGEKEYTDKGIQGKFSGTSFSGNSYQNWEQEGGWFSGDDDGTETSPLDSATTNSLSTSFTLLKLETGRLAAGLGVDTANIAAYSKAINLTLTDDAEANTKAITDMIAGISEEMSAMVLAGTNFKLAGETSSETLSRLYNSLVTVNSAFESINISAYATSLSGGDMASQLALLMGGIDSFKTSITSYYSTYFSAQEQQADLVKQTTESIKALGVAVPATKEGFRALIEGLDMTTAAGRTTFAGLMSVSAAFATMTDAAAAAAAAALKSATELSASVAGDAYAALDRAVSAQKKALETAYTKQKNEWDIAVAAANEIKGTLTSLSSTLHSAVRSIVVESDSLSLSRRAEAQVTLNSAVVTSKSGGSLAPFADAITGAIADLSAPSESLYASFEEYARAQGRANAALTELQNASDSQLSVAGRTLKEIQSASDAAEAAYTKQLADLDETLSVAKLQLDATNGINTTVLTMSDALKALSASITGLALNRSLSGLPTGTGSSSTAINTAGVTAAYDKYLGTTGDKAGIAWQVAHIADGSNTLAQIVDNIANSADAQKKAINDAYVTYLGSNADSAGMAWQLAHIADGSNTLAQIVENIKNAGSSNSHASGLERVPYDGYKATLHAGEAVVDAQSTRAISRYFGGGGGNNNDAMVAELKALREEVNLLRYEARSTATNTGRTAKALDKFDNDGMPAERIAA